MIRTEAEYRDTRARIDAALQRQRDERHRLEEQGLASDEIKRLLEPVTSFFLSLQEEVKSYERICRGDFREVENFHGIGRMLIGLRIYSRISQRELARRLNIDESQVSRDERNEYHGITVERANAVIEALGARLTTRIELPEPHAAGT